MFEAKIFFMHHCLHLELKDCMTGKTDGHNKKEPIKLGQTAVEKPASNDAFRSCSNTSPTHTL